MVRNNTQFLALIGQQPGEKGRATIYNSDFHCSLVKELAQDGDFQEAWASEIGITVGTMREWALKHEEFLEAIIIAHQLLLTFWTRKIAANVTSEGAKPGMFQILVRRFPAIYGRTPIDLQAWLMEGAGEAAAAPEALTADQARAVTTDDLTVRLEALRRRRAEERE